MISEVCGPLTDTAMMRKNNNHQLPIKLRRNTPPSTHRIWWSASMKGYRPASMQ